ncbi:MAG: hypothetical protein H8D45_17370 [Bacteroidetes bacterium]|nr:hypothetical protein [Bacteroidota bacterium]MBL7103267.1 hypothetical protein [Bacteroidales bacterium]
MGRGVGRGVGRGIMGITPVCPDCRQAGDKGRNPRILTFGLANPHCFRINPKEL